MKNSKRIQNMLKSLDTIYEYLEYYMDGNTGLSAEYHELRKHIEELSLEQKEHNARFAKKLKYLWSTDEEN